MRKNPPTCLFSILGTEIRFSSRDWKLLDEDYLPGSAAFLNQLGFVGITSVADGLRIGQTVERERDQALAAARSLWAMLETQLDLLSSDYLCDLGTGRSALVSRRLGNVRANGVEYSIEMPPGQCRLETAPTVVKELHPTLGRVCVRAVRHPVEDLRLKKEFASDNYGLIRIRRRRRETYWRTALPALVELLSNPSTPRTLAIYNEHR